MEQCAKKICTKCLVALPIDQFYSKGNRIDSRCKECVKSTKKTKYVSAEESLRVNSLFQFFELITEIEITVINQQIQRLDEEIKRCQTKTAQ